MLSLDELFDTFDMRLDSVRYGHRDRTMEAQITFTTPMATFDEEVHEGLARRYDDYEDADWRIGTLDIDDGPEVAWFIFVIAAKTPAACRDLQRRIPPASFWFEETTVA